MTCILAMRATDYLAGLLALSAVFVWRASSADISACERAGWLSQVTT